ncbi:hypothetical protein NHX12_024838 [Muraenolepis orangiensis]|uniref:Tectonic domain-containing protein n=1 Tax=Muraenolepis orangiensis TaxID=630683 RepID=A0A9Q0ENY9_9TELE|nr:hypothetical protein NHX12_024838 [Muraenolepis orangiensis]
MTPPARRRSLHLWMVVCVGLTRAATESGPTAPPPPGSPTADGGSLYGPTPGEGSDGPTPTPGGLTTTSPEEENNNNNNQSSGLDATTGDPNSTAAANQTEVTPVTGWSTGEPPSISPSPSPGPGGPLDVCLCDLSPGLCDIGCCCDLLDCGVADLRSVFRGCPEETRSGSCVEDWLMFRANVDPALVTRADGLFCVRPPENGTFRSAPSSLPAAPALGASYRFSGPEPLVTRPHARPFYRVDDVILTYYSTSSLWGLLRQPSPGAGSASCVDRNPAKFMRSSVVSCTRVLPVPESEQPVDMLVPVTPLSSWPAPRRLDRSCLHVVAKVELEVVFTGRGELSRATVSLVLADVELDRLLSQSHSLSFTLATPRPTPSGPIPAVGLPLGSPVIGRFNGSVAPITVMGVSDGGECSSDPRRRSPVLFPRNTITGCSFRPSSPGVSCSELRFQLYQVLQGLVSPPDHLAMNWGPEPDWTRVLLRDCPPVDIQESCETGCTLPLSLSIRVLWARLGWMDLPQNHILGAQYHFLCETIKLLFVDTTSSPPAPRARPQPGWRLPFDFLGRGAAELDGHALSGGAGAGGVVRPCSALTLLLVTAAALLVALESSTSTPMWTS